MKKLLIQLGFVFSCAILFSGCSNEGSLPAEAEEEVFFDPLPQGLPVFTEIDEAFVADSLEGNGRSALFSYQLAENEGETSEIKEVLAADNRLLLSLNTLNDPKNTGRSEVTLLVRNDSVYSVNHLSNQIRLLSHFTNTVCELIPREIVEIEEIKDGTTGDVIEKIFTVRHDELIYVMTAEGDASTACTGEGKKRFYALPLDHQLDPTQDADGELNALELVNESLARAKLIFGWVPDPQQNDATKQKMAYGFLGYGTEEVESPTLKPALVLYNESRQEVWRQDRSIEKFPVLEVTPDVYSQPYLFHVQALENQHYLVQLGLDVFVVDSGEAFLSKDFNETEEILSDRSLALSPEMSKASSPQEYALPVKAYYDDDDLLIENQGKVFSYAYQVSTPARNPLENLSYKIIPQNPMSITSREFAGTRYFSQFDLAACEDDLNCQTAHDVEALEWQFLTPCTEALGCSLNNQVADFCETFDEKLITPSDEPLCTASDYRHLSELNQSSNDMTFKGYMQYKDYMRDVKLTLDNNRLYITARMNEKDLLLRYNYALDFSAPKSQREPVLFGKHMNLFGLDVHFANGNLFMTALSQGAIRSNECYKNYQRVPCELGELTRNGSSSCTGKDLAEGLCTNQFQEYESHALFCSSLQLTDLSCSDINLAQIEDLSIESPEEDAKWLSLYDYTSSASNAYQMQLLVGSHTTALDDQLLDEGRLVNPEVYKVDVNTGQKGELLGKVEGQVEQAVQGWVVKQAIADSVDVLAHFQLISEEVVDGTSSLQSELVNFLIEQSFDEPDPLVPITPITKKVKELGVSRFERP